MALNVPLIYYTNEYNDTWGDDNHDNEESDDDGGGGEGEMMGSKSNGKQLPWVSERTNYIRCT